ncbi:MAG: hypothetical protein JWO52_4919 [Gammaproteobacteria bacterium]|nr:hypothetical protein [Gammaproteobacteria bacterium]
MRVRIVTRMIRISKKVNITAHRGCMRPARPVRPRPVAWPGWFGLAWQGAPDSACRFGPPDSPRWTPRALLGPARFAWSARPGVALLAARLGGPPAGSPLLGRLTLPGPASPGFALLGALALPGPPAGPCLVRAAHLAGPACRALPRKGRSPCRTLPAGLRCWVPRAAPGPACGACPIGALLGLPGPGPGCWLSRLWAAATDPRRGRSHAIRGVTRNRAAPSPP